MLPLTVFLVLGSIQLFTLLQGRILAQYATFRAARAGSLNYGDCDAMTEAAIATLIPAIHPFLAPGGDPSTRFLQAFKLRRNNRFDPAQDSGHNRDIVWIFRERPFTRDVTPDMEDTFDLPYSPSVQPSKPPMLIELRMVFWYPLRIPFANWVMSRMVLASFGLRPYRAVNPLIPADKDANWDQTTQGPADARVRNELLSRITAGQYTLPIQTSYVMRMMTPPRPRYFGQQNCPPL